MIKKDFYELFAKKMQVANNLNEETPVESFNPWDSWARLEVMAFVEQTFNVNLSAKDMMEIKTIGDLMSKIGNKYFE